MVDGISDPFGVVGLASVLLLQVALCLKIAVLRRQNLAQQVELDKLRREKAVRAALKCR